MTTYDTYVPISAFQWDVVIDTLGGDLVFKNLDQTEMLWFLKLLTKAEWERKTEKSVEAILKRSKPPITQEQTNDGVS